MGGIVIEIDFDQAYKVWSEFSELTVGEIRQRFSMDDAYEKHERGEIASFEYYSHLRTVFELRANNGIAQAGERCI